MRDTSELRSTNKKSIKYNFKQIKVQFVLSFVGWKSIRYGARELPINLLTTNLLTSRLLNLVGSSLGSNPRI